MSRHIGPLELEASGTPAANGRWQVYLKPDGLLYRAAPDGTEAPVSSGGSGGSSEIPVQPEEPPATEGQLWYDTDEPSRGDRATATLLTSTLAPEATESATITLAKGYRLLSVETDRPARVRLYATDAHRVADAGRLVTEDPVGDHGVLLEYVTTASRLYATLTPSIDGASMEATPVPQIPALVTNLDATTATVLLTLVYVRTE